MLDQLLAVIKEQGFLKSYCVALSGGLDSQVLLKLCVELRKEYSFSLRAIHVHHGLSREADSWAAHCHETCEALQVPFIQKKIDARAPGGESLEAYARKLRYAVLKEALNPDEILLTAHHQDDQAETLLLQLLRGAGPKGLSAMPRVKPFGRGLLARPFLAHTRADLRAYALEKRLSWVEDELNQDSRYPRNLLRHEVFTLLKQNFPKAPQTLARSARLCAEAQQLLEDYADVDLIKMRGSQAGTLSVKQLLELRPARQRLIVRRWIELQGFELPSAAKLSQVEKVFQARPDSMPCVKWGQAELRRHRDDLYLLASLNPSEKDAVYSWDLQGPLEIQGVGNLVVQERLGEGLQSRFKSIEVRFRRGGESYRLPNGQSRALKKFFQEQGIPSWERERLPLIYAGDELLAIPGYWMVSQFRAAQNEIGWTVRLEN